MHNKDLFSNVADSDDVAVRVSIKDAYCFRSSNVNPDRLFALIYAGAVIIIANASARR